jgi:hypothetical protein
MYRVQVRRYNPQEVDDLVLEGELFYDDERRRLGISVISDGVKFQFLPEVDDELTIIGTNEYLTGREKINGDVNNLVLDWSNQDQLDIKHRISGAVIASLGINGSKINLVPEEVTTVATTRNLAVNGNFSIKRNVDHKVTFQTDPGTDNIHLFAPNWLIWCTDTSNGSLSVQFDEIDVDTTVGSMDRVLSVTASNFSDDCGVRTFFFDYNFVVSSQIVVSFDYKAPEDEVSNVKILSSTNSNILTAQITGTGDWARAEIPVFMPAGTPTWWAIDVLSEPSSGSEDPINWKIGALQVNKGSTAITYEKRSKQAENVLVSDLYQEGRVFIIDDSDVQTVQLNNTVVTPNKVSIVNPTDGTPSVTGLDSTGFEVEIPDLVDVDGSVLKYAAYFINPTT